MLNFSIFGGFDLGKRPWKPGKTLWAITLLGGMEIDFQQAQLEEAVTKVVCISFLGGMDIIVPPGLPVTLSGFSLFGGRDMKLSKPEAAEPPSGKSLHIRAFTIIGGVDIKPPEEKKP